MTIGEKIRDLRKKNNITQETLAAYLNISYQSVSKWENGTASPDISHLVPLANIFNITLDELFDRGAETQAADMEVYLAKNMEFAHAGQIENRLSLWREALAKYPNNYRCMQMLANSLWQCRNSTAYSAEEKEAMLRESIALNERVFAECNDLATKFSALQILVFTYGNPAYACADEEKAVYYAGQAPSFYCSYQMFAEHAYYKEENLEKRDLQRQLNILSFVDCAAHRLRTAATYKTPEERIRAFKAGVNLWHALIDDGNFLFYHCRLSALHSSIAGNYAVLGDRENTLFHAKAAMEHARAYDNLPDGVQHYTVPALSLAYSDASQSSKNYKETDTQLLLAKFAEPWYDFLREDPEFRAIVGQAETGESA
ncbi:MAG: helix-turn-helix transcriptional regulator [Clostridia bacterium]|nr:helix-turn-helix transcriptional regulator [Clostridia bacterium]